MLEIEFILYVSDQGKSTEFYKKLLQLNPCLNVPGMTEFKINEFTKLGLMPEKGISKIISPIMPNPEEGNGIPRCELYLKVQNSIEYLNRGIELGAKIISKSKDRDWGDTVGYIADIDGHIIAFAEK
ncbi:MAG: lactoylglutathione lyase [Crocinitomix sp.]|nr:lactoylglutathione lyase [Crocinitomix sp.]